MFPRKHSGTGPSRDDADSIVASSLCPTRQSSANHEQVRQRRHALKAMQVLRQAAVADLPESEGSLDHPDAALDLRALGSFGQRTRRLLPTPSSMYGT